MKPFGNSHPVGIFGVIVAVAGMVAPVVASHLHASPDIVSMISQISAYFNGGGLAAAYLGKPVTVQS